MVSSIQGAYGFQLTAPNTPLRPCELHALDPRADELVVEVAGCGVCHTDIGFVFEGVPTRHALPLIRAAAPVVVPSWEPGSPEPGRDS